MISGLVVRRIFPIILLAFSVFPATAQDADVEAGKTLFRNLCASCHNKDMKSDLTGPALGGAEERWAAFPKEDLYSWIRNSQALVKAGHPRAVEVYNQWKQVQMTAFTSLTDPEIANILAYINCAFTNTCPGSAFSGCCGCGSPKGENRLSVPVHTCCCHSRRVGHRAGTHPCQPQLHDGGTAGEYRGAPQNPCRAIDQPRCDRLCGVCPHRIGWIYYGE